MHFDGPQPRASIGFFQEKVAIFLNKTTGAPAEWFNDTPRSADHMLICRACGEMDINNWSKICPKCSYDEASDSRTVRVPVSLSVPVVRAAQEVDVSISNYLRNGNANSPAVNCSFVRRTDANGNQSCVACGRFPNDHARWRMRTLRLQCVR